MGKSLFCLVGILLVLGICNGQLRRGGGRLRQIMMMREREMALRRAFPFGLPRQMRGPVPPGVAARLALAQRQRRASLLGLGLTGTGLNPLLGTPLNGVAGNQLLGNPFATGVNNQLGLGTNPAQGLGLGTQLDMASLGLGAGVGIGGSTIGTSGLQNSLATGGLTGLQNSIASGQINGLQNPFLTGQTTGLQNSLATGQPTGSSNTLATGGATGLTGTNGGAFGQSTSVTGQTNTLAPGNNAMFGQQGNQPAERQSQIRSRSDSVSARRSPIPLSGLPMRPPIPDQVGGVNMANPNRRRQTRMPPNAAGEMARPGPRRRPPFDRNGAQQRRRRRPPLDLAPPGIENTGRRDRSRSTRRQRGFPQIPQIPTIPAVAPNQAMNRGNQNVNTMTNPGRMNGNTQQFPFIPSSTGSMNPPFTPTTGFSSQGVPNNAIFPSQVAQGPVIRQRGPGFMGPMNGMEFPSVPRVPQIPAIPAIPANPNGPAVSFPSGIQRFGPSNQQQGPQNIGPQNTQFQQTGNMFPPTQTNQPGQQFGNQQFQFGGQPFAFGPAFNTPGSGQPSGQNMNIQFQPITNNQQFPGQFGQNQNQNQNQVTSVVSTDNNQNTNAFNTGFENTQSISTDGFTNTQNNVDSASSQQGNQGIMRFDNSAQTTGSGAQVNTVTTNGEQGKAAGGEFTVVEVGNILESNPGFDQMNAVVESSSNMGGSGTQGDNFMPTGDINLAFNSFPAGSVQDLTVPTAAPVPEPMNDTATLSADITGDVPADTMLTPPSPMKLNNDFSFFVSNDNTATDSKTVNLNDQTSSSATGANASGEATNFSYGEFFDRLGLPADLSMSNNGSQIMRFDVEGLPKNQPTGSNNEAFSFLTSNTPGDSAATTVQDNTIVLPSKIDTPPQDVAIPPGETNSMTP